MPSLKKLFNIYRYGMNTHKPTKTGTSWRRLVSCTV